MPALRLTREEKRAATRARLIDAAAHVFAERGFVAASVDEVAERVGLTKGAVYSNFVDKEDLFFAVLEQRLDQRVIDVAQMVDAGAPLADQAKEATLRFLETFEEERVWFLLTLEFTAYAARTPRFRPRYVARYRNIRAAITRAVQERVTAAGLQLPIPVDQLAIGLSALAQGIALEKLIDDEAVPDHLFGTMLGLIYGTVAAEAEGRARRE